MEVLQKIFKPRYVKDLYNNLDVSKYKANQFDYDKNQVKNLANVYCINDNLPAEMEALASKAEDDCKAAILFYESYKGITPLVAAMPELWVYLTHVDLFNYTKKRWPLDINTVSKVLDKEKKELKEDELETEESHENPDGDDDNSKLKKYIRDHWFKVKHPMRTTIMNLWWAVYCTIDEEREDKYELTKYFFSRTDLRTRRLGTSKFFRFREAAIGILEFMIENQKLMDNYFEGKMIYITKYFNMLGGTTQLTYMKREFFKRELESKKEIMKSINSRNDILNNFAILKV